MLPELFRSVARCRHGTDLKLTVALVQRGSKQAVAHKHTPYLTQHRAQLGTRQMLEHVEGHDTGERIARTGSARMSAIATCSRGSHHSLARSWLRRVTEGLGELVSGEDLRDSRRVAVPDAFPATRPIARKFIRPDCRTLV
jgi:hypothetical protein